jgi:hypothetical protein
VKSAGRRAGLVPYPLLLKVLHPSCWFPRPSNCTLRTGGDLGPRVLGSLRHPRRSGCRGLRTVSSPNPSNWSHITWGAMTTQPQWRVHERLWAGRDRVSMSVGALARARHGTLWRPRLWQIKNFEGRAQQKMSFRQRSCSGSPRVLVSMTLLQSTV